MTIDGICPENYNSKALVELWGDFVDWEKRRVGENGFLANNLKQYGCRKVFDACLGEGVDSIHLVEEGFDVTSNDIDLLFIKKAKENAKNITLNVTQHDWRELGNHFEAEEFDAVCCLGNSITYLFNRDDRLKTLRNFRHMLKEGKILIIDERNYQYMLDKRDEILGGKFRYSGKYVYCGDKVHGRPIEIFNSSVRIEYTDERKGQKAHLVLYPFKRNELFDLLNEAGFKKVERFSDYTKGYNPDADFYQYICVK